MPFKFTPMSNARQEQLLQFHNQDPTDPFILYGLALEYQKSDNKKAEELFDKLLTDHGITHEYHLTDGTHSWPTFRQNLIAFLPRLFQP